MRPEVETPPRVVGHWLAGRGTQDPLASGGQVHHLGAEEGDIVIDFKGPACRAVLDSQRQGDQGVESLAHPGEQLAGPLG